MGRKMQKFCYTLAAIVTAGAVFGLSAPAPAQTLADSVAMPAAKKKPPVRRHITAGPQGQIACTRLGCRHIPPNCHPETEYNWDGNPTGFDKIVCR